MYTAYVLGVDQMHVTVAAVALCWHSSDVAEHIAQISGNQGPFSQLMYQCSMEVADQRGKAAQVLSACVVCFAVQCAGVWFRISYGS